MWPFAFALQLCNFLFFHILAFWHATFILVRIAQEYAEHAWTARILHFHTSFEVTQSYVSSMIRTKQRTAIAPIPSKMIFTLQKTPFTSSNSIPSQNGQHGFSTITREGMSSAKEGGGRFSIEILAGIRKVLLQFGFLHFNIQEVSWNLTLFARQ